MWLIHGDISVLSAGFVAGDVSPLLLHRRDVSISCGANRRFFRDTEVDVDWGPVLGSDLVWVWESFSGNGRESSGGETSSIGEGSGVSSGAGPGLLCSEGSLNESFTVLSRAGAKRRRPVDNL